MITENNYSAFTQVLLVLGTFLFSIIVIVCALLLSVYVFEHTKGQNYSDVGVPMYTNDSGAGLLGLICYIGIIIVVPTLIWSYKKSKLFLYTYCIVQFFPLLFTIIIFRILMD